MKITLFFIVQFAFLSSFFAQDTLSVYFDFGKSKIRSDQEIKLKTELKEFNFLFLDSIHCLGMADSVGKIEANVRLSLRRAKEVSKYLNRTENLDVPIALFAEGEKEADDPQMNRRVDIVFFFTPDEDVEIMDVSLPIKADGCYRIAYGTIALSHITKYKKGKKEYVLLENEHGGAQYEPMDQQYYGTLNAEGEFVVKKLRWKVKSTGSFWWKKKRNVAKLPKKDYDKFKIFVIDSLPCTNCHEDLEKNKAILSKDLCWWHDDMVLRNLQFRRAWFQPNTVKVRVPKEYIDIEEKYIAQYLVGRKIRLTTQWRDVEWDTKWLGKRKRYYYSKLSVLNNEVANIYREFSCNLDPSCPQYTGYYRIPCGFRDGGGGGFVPVEIGAYFQNEYEIGYLATGYSYFGRPFETELLIGLQTNLNFYSSLRFRLRLITLNFEDIRPNFVWKQVSKPSNWYTSLYVGTELKTSLGNTAPQFIEPNGHAGLSFYYFGMKRFLRIYGQVGYGFDALRKEKIDPYNMLNFGVTVYF